MEKGVLPPPPPVALTTKATVGGTPPIFITRIEPLARMTQHLTDKNALGDFFFFLEGGSRYGLISSHPSVGVAVVGLRQKVPGRLSSSCEELPVNEVI